MAGFLTAWLVGWGAGESSALWVLWRALHGGEGPQALVMAVVVWTSLWTLGGVLAAAMLLRCLGAEDRLERQGEHQLVVRRWIPPDPPGHRD
ncbi:hypothetical protein [Cyanobium sp. NIES-981]|uniref:hypothetical protein n=1 Tax=Cyanobium sp. NIES-981 TaxID=1851505 RepID=UPI0012F71D78|nr:hypothetical protein [Cyanobium sp. NIES-981]